MRVNGHRSVCLGGFHKALTHHFLLLSGGTDRGGAGREGGV